MNLQSGLKLNLVVATVLFFFSAAGIGVIGEAQEQPAQPKFVGPSPGERSDEQEPAQQRPPRPMYLPGPMVPEDAKPKGKVKRRPPQPRLGGGAPPAKPQGKKPQRTPQPKAANFGIVTNDKPKSRVRQRPPQPKFGGPIAPEDAKPVGKGKQRPPRPKFGGEAPQVKTPQPQDDEIPVVIVGGSPSQDEQEDEPAVITIGDPSSEAKQLKQEEPKSPTPQLAGLEMELKDLQEMERDLVLRQKQLQDVIAASPQDDKIRQLKYQTAALEVEQKLLTVRNESEQLVQRVSFLRHQAANEHEAASDQIRVNDEIESILEKADHLQSAVVHLHEGGLKELAEKVAEESFELRRKADELAREAHERSLRRKQEEHRLRKQAEEMIKSLKDKQQGQTLYKPVAPDPVQKEMLGAIRELNQAVRQLREEMEQMRQEMDKR